MAARCSSSSTSTRCSRSSDRSVRVACVTKRAGSQSLPALLLPATCLDHRSMEWLGDAGVELPTRLHHALPMARRECLKSLKGLEGLDAERGQRVIDARRDG